MWVEVSATGLSLVQKSSAEGGVSVCDLETSTMGWPIPSRTVGPQGKG